MVGISKLSETKSVNAIAHGMAADRRAAAIARHHLFDQRLDMLRQSVSFACECGTQQPISYFLADGGAANAVDLNSILNGWVGHERLPACLAAGCTDKSRLKLRVATVQA
jgi:hypothetical protein